MKTVAKIVKVDRDGGIAMNHFVGWINVDRVKFYSVKSNKDKTLTVKFYDKNRKLVKPNERKY